MTKKVTRLVIITETVLLSKVTKIIEAAGATGYTVMAAGGVGSRNTRSSGQPAVSDTFSNVKLEVLTASEDVARSIADQVAKKYFDNFSGIAYLDDVEVLYANRL
jgi:nitrogen regulatory protein PII